jgi:hypothetical protein
MTTFTRPVFYSRLAQLLSGLCLLHCLAMPFVVVLLPGVSPFFGDAFEFWITLSVVPVAAIGFIPTWLSHRNGFIAFKFAAGLALLVLGGTIFHESHESVVHAAEGTAILEAGFSARTLISLSGALLLGFTMFRNNRHVHTCHNPHHQH